MYVLADHVEVRVIDGYLLLIQLSATPLAVEYVFPCGSDHPFCEYPVAPVHVLVNFWFATPYVYFSVPPPDPLLQTNVTVTSFGVICYCSTCCSIFNT